MIESGLVAREECSSWAVEVRGLTKTYGSVRALNLLDLSVSSGCVFGLLGANGAGKSTLLRVLMGLIRPSSGDIHVLGEALEQRNWRRIGGFIDSPRFHPVLTGAETLYAASLMVGVEQCPTKLLARVGLGSARDIRVDSYSLGMKQRLAIATALVGNPEVIILDEPLNGLDPNGILEVRDLIRSLGDQEGVTVLMSSHLLDEVERVCDEVAIIKLGGCILQGRVDELLRTRGMLRLRAEPIEAILRIAGPKASLKAGQVHVSISEEETPALIATLCAQGVVIYEAYRERPTLEALFLEETGR